MKKFAAILILLFSFFFFSGQTEAKGEGQLILINKANNKLAYYNEGKMVKTFKVATGRKRSYTPEGKFKIVTKIVNRPYYKENIPGGHPRNPLGDRWMGINARGTYGTTYAIHGNNNPSSIGTYASSGCIRMYDSDVRWLYGQVKKYTPVIISHSSKSFDAIAASNGYVPKSTIGKVTVSKKSPQLKHTAVTINASASAGYSPSFKYSVHDGKKWTTLKNYSANKSVKWTPTKAGSYKLKVEVKSKQSKNAFDAQKIISYNIFETASIKSVKTDKASPQLKNTNINLSAVSNNNANNLFQYSYSTDGGKKWTVVKKYSSSAKINWKPAVPGQYKIKVQTKHKWSKNAYDHERTIAYNIYDDAVLTSFTTDKGKETIQPVNTDITFLANSNNNANNLFRYSYSTDGGKTWTTINDYSTSTEIKWTPKTPGEYKIRVQIKHKLSNKAQSTYVDFNILSLAELTGNTSVTGRLERNAQGDTANGTEEDEAGS